LNRPARIEREGGKKTSREQREKLSHPVSSDLFNLLPSPSFPPNKKKKKKKQVEEISAAESHKKAAQTKADPLEEFCKDSPDAVSQKFFPSLFFFSRVFSLSFSFSSFSSLAHSLASPLFIIPPPPPPPTTTTTTSQDECRVYED